MGVAIIIGNFFHHLPIFNTYAIWYWSNITFVWKMAAENNQLLDKDLVEIPILS